MDCMRRHIVLAVTGLLALAGSSCSTTIPCDAPPPRLVFRTSAGHPSLTVEVAMTPVERAQGLMGRSSLGPDEGMVFAYDSPSTDGFWMKDTKIPLSIAFWGTSGRIRQILDMQPCTADPCHVYRTTAPFVGAVEASQGYFAEHGIHVGDVADLHQSGCP